MSDTPRGPVPVTVDSFVRAESDRYFAQWARSSLGVFQHIRALPSLTDQQVIRMNLDTLYSPGVFDLDAGPVTVRLPDTAGRFMSLLPVSQDHYTPGCVYGPGPHVFTREGVGTRYVALIVRTFVDAGDPADLPAVHALQDAITVEQPGRGSFVTPDWDPATLGIVRDTLLRVAPGLRPGRGFGTRDEVDPVAHLVLTAAGWGGNPERDATYSVVFPERNDGGTPYRLTVGAVPVDGFWSVTVYGPDGYLAPNPYHRYAVNNVTAVPDPDGTISVQLGGDGAGARNWIPTVPGWNYVVRLYRPRAEVLDRSWTFPAAVPIA